MVSSHKRGLFPSHITPVRSSELGGLDVFTLYGIFHAAVGSRVGDGSLGRGVGGHGDTEEARALPGWEEADGGGCACPGITGAAAAAAREAGELPATTQAGVGLAATPGVVVSSQGNSG